MASKELVLKAEIREKLGSKKAAAERKKGKIPAVIYGHNQTPQAIALNGHDLIEGLHNGTRLFDIQIGQSKEKLMIKDVQFDYLGKNVIHADFLRVDLSEKVQVEVPVKIKGIPAEGILEEHLDRLEIECIVVEIPELFTISAKTMKIGDYIYAKDIPLPAGVKLLTDADAIVAACKEPKAIEEPTAAPEGEEAAAEPEVITERKPKEDEETEEKK